MSFPSDDHSSDEDLFAPSANRDSEQLSSDDDWVDDDEYIQPSDDNDGDNNDNDDDEELFGDEGSDNRAQSNGKGHKTSRKTRVSEGGEEGEEDADMSDEDIVPDIPQGYQFNASQVAYLKTRLQQYREGSAKRRETLVSMSVQNFASELYAITGKKLSQKRKAQMRKAVINWFKGRLEKGQAKAKKSVWGGRYYGQLVFKRERTRIVQYLADIIVRNAPMPNLRDLIDNEDVFLSKNQQKTDSDDEGPSNDRTKQTPEGFTKFQTAASMLWKALSAKERKEYDRKAKAWKEATPPLEQQRKAAERMASKRLMQFAEGVLHEMNARLYMLVAFEKADGKPIAFDFELSGGNAGANGQAFRDLYDAQLKEMGLLELWKDFAADVYLDPLEQEEERRGKRVAKKALMKFKRNEYAEPIIPEISEKPGTEQRAKWLARFLRSYMTIHYNIARGNPTGRTPVPWRRVALNIRRFISTRFLPDHLAEILQEPSLMTANERETLYKFFLRRQRKGEVDNVFEFKNVWDRKSKTYKPRHPRTLASEYPSDYNEDDDDAEDDNHHGWQPEDIQKDTTTGEVAGSSKGANGERERDSLDRDEDENLFQAPLKKVLDGPSAKSKSTATEKAKSKSKSKSQPVVREEEGVKEASVQAKKKSKAGGGVDPKQKGKGKAKDPSRIEPQSQQGTVSDDEGTVQPRSKSSRGLPKAQSQAPPGTHGLDVPMQDEVSEPRSTSRRGSDSTSNVTAGRQGSTVQDSHEPSGTPDSPSDGERGTSREVEDTVSNPPATPRSRGRETSPPAQESEDDEVDELPRAHQTRAKARRTAEEPVAQPQGLRRSSRAVKVRKIFGEDFTPPRPRTARPPRSAQVQQANAKKRGANSTDNPPAKRRKVATRSSTTAQKQGTGRAGAKKSGIR